MPHLGKRKIIFKSALREHILIFPGGLSIMLGFKKHPFGGETDACHQEQVVACSCHGSRRC